MIDTWKDPASWVGWWSSTIEGGEKHSVDTWKESIGVVVWLMTSKAEDRGFKPRFAHLSVLLKIRTSMYLYTPHPCGVEKDNRAPLTSVLTYLPWLASFTFIKKPAPTKFYVVSEISDRVWTTGHTDHDKGLCPLMGRFLTSIIMCEKSPQRNCKYWIKLFHSF